MVSFQCPIAPTLILYFDRKKSFASYSKKVPATATIHPPHASAAPVEAPTAERPPPSSSTHASPVAGSPTGAVPPSQSTVEAIAEAARNNPLSGFFSSIWNATSGSIRLDLRRPVVPHWKEQESLLRVGNRWEREEQGRDSRRRGTGRGRGAPPPPPPQTAGPLYSGIRIAVDEIEPVNGQDSSGKPSTLNRAIRGARVKITRHVTLGQLGDGPGLGVFETKRRPPLDLGVGVSFELDKGLLFPVARARFGDHVSLHAFPEPSVRVEGTWKVFNTGLNLTARYQCPLANVEQFWQPPSRLIVRLDHEIGKGVHVGPFGMDIDSKLFESKSKNTWLRVAGSVAFPRQIPLEEGDPVLRFDIRRLGIKSSW